MLRLLGTPRTLCDGRTRRDFLRIGGLGAFASITTSVPVPEPSTYLAGVLLLVLHGFGIIPFAQDAIAFAKHGGPLSTLAWAAVTFL